jgi:ribonuclease E
VATEPAASTSAVNSGALGLLKRVFGQIFGAGDKRVEPEVAAPRAPAKKASSSRPPRAKDENRTTPNRLPRAATQTSESDARSEDKRRDEGKVEGTKPEGSSNRRRRSRSRKPAEAQRDAQVNTAASVNQPAEAPAVTTDASEGKGSAKAPEKTTARQREPRSSEPAVRPIAAHEQSLIDQQLKAPVASPSALPLNVAVKRDPAAALAPNAALGLLADDVIVPAMVAAAITPKVEAQVAAPEPEDTAANEVNVVPSAPAVESQAKAPADTTIAAVAPVVAEPVSAAEPVVHTKEEIPAVAATASPVTTSTPAPEPVAEQVVAQPEEATNDSPWSQVSATLAAKQEEVSAPAALETKVADEPVSEKAPTDVPSDASAVDDVEPPVAQVESIHDSYSAASERAPGAEAITESAPVASTPVEAVIEAEQPEATTAEAVTEATPQVETTPQEDVQPEAIATTDSAEETVRKEPNA